MQTLNLLLINLKNSFRFMYRYLLFTEEKENSMDKYPIYLNIPTKPCPIILNCNFTKINQRNLLHS